MKRRRLRMNNTNGILVVSFGSSYEETRKKSIDQLEKEIQEAYPEFSLYRAFTSLRIIKGLKEKGTQIDDVEEALEKMRGDGIKKVIVQPTFMIRGLEYEKMCKSIEKYKQDFKALYIGAPLLTSVEDYFEVIEIIANEVNKIQEDEVILCMGHGVEHFMSVSYAALDYMFKDRGYENFYVATIDAFPRLEDVMKHFDKKGYKRVRILPFMLVAGHHVQKSVMEQVQGSWKVELESAGYKVECVFKGLGEYQKIRNLYRKHIQVWIDKL